MESIEMATITLKRPLSTEDLVSEEAKRPKVSESSFIEQSFRELQETVIQSEKAIETEDTSEVLTKKIEDEESEGENELLGESEDGDPESFADMMKHGLVELDVGITQFVSSHKGFSGILKER